ncbi:hypothetical protein AXF42_Ash011228 [Apostasia shenzhenica]|uniref:Uncharacterized protein n=1 Tax=Apostasia shenzhenica TaxID=1088818 RepID=A0A2I0AL61_9ASPA|nr:hypothetical protein AXF42_Ash011228 [Apostasia shenzhenica]
MEEAGKGKESAISAKLKVVPKDNKGIVIGEKEGERKAEEKGQKRGEEVEVQGETVSPCLDLVLKEVPKRKRDPKEKRSSEPLSKKGNIVEEGQLAVKGAYDWQRSIDLPYHINFAGRFGDDVSLIAVGTKGDEKTPALPVIDGTKLRTPGRLGTGSRRWLRHQGCGG